MSGKQHSSQKNAANSVERDCTHWCKSKTHAIQLISAITSRVSTDSLKSYFSTLCNNFPNVTDRYGRSVLHFASSIGDWRLVEWLIEKCRCDIDLKDLESGWTALHRSFFYGQISVARVLLRHSASVTITDNNNFTPLELQMIDRPVYIEFSKSDPCDCYVWGDNDNFNLGVDSEHARKSPEIINSFRRDGVSIKQVCIDKFHTVFLSNDGRVFSCGTGHGGRLGHDNEELAITPKLVRGFGGNSSLFCEMIATGEDHMVLLVRSMDNKSPPQVYTCGMNTYHVLGHSVSPIPERLLSPKPICLKSLSKTGSNYKMGEIIGVGAGRYHTLFYTKDELFTFGLNVGQLGHPNNAGERTIVTPRRVPTKFVQTSDENKNYIQHVTTSDGAIVVANNKGEVYVIHEYQSRKILSNQYEIDQICCVGGHLNERSDVNGILAHSRVELKIMVLTNTKKIFLWKGSDPILVQCLLVYGRELSVTHICLNSKFAGFVTKDAEVFFGAIVDRKSKTQPKLSDSSSNKSVKSFVKFIKRDECHTIRVKRQPLIHRAVSLVTDSKNKNFAALIASPKLGMIELASKPVSEMCGNFRLLYETSCAEDCIHDCLIKVGHRQYAVHKYILASRSSYFSKRFESDFDCDKIEIDTSFVSVESFEQILRFLYYNSNDMFENDKKLLWMKVEESDLNEVDTKKKDNKKKKPAKKKKNLKETLKELEPLQELWESCKKLGVKWLHKWLTGGGVKIIGGNKVRLAHRSPPTPPKLTFNRNLRPELYDVVIKSSDGFEFPCHRCILVARLDYFRGMLGSGFIEASIDSKAITLPVNARILDILMDYMYTDEAPKLMASDDPEFICHVLVVADQFLIPFLKQHCEYNLINLLNLKNSCELLELSYIYNAEQLRRCCVDFICINLLHLIETRAIDVLSDEAMKDLTKQYRQMLAMQRPIPRPYLYDTRRSIDRYSCAPNDDEFERIFMSNIINDDFNVNFEERKAYLKQQKSRIRKLSNNNRQRTESLTESATEASPQQLSPKLSDTRQPIKNEKSREESVTMKTSVSFDEIKSIIGSSEPKMAIKWGSISMSAIPPPLSFKDIIAEEESMAKPNPFIGKSSMSPINVPKSGKMNRVSNNRQTPQSLSADNSSPRSFAAMAVSPPKPYTNPWKKIDSSLSLTPPSVSMPMFPSIDGTISMRDIVRDEQEKQNNLKRFDAKPLDLIAVEDKAIEELLIYYNAIDNPFECVSVQRVTIDRNRIAAPVWTKRH